MWNGNRQSTLLKSVALLVIVFGVVTVVSGGTVLFGSDTTQEMAGQFVPFVVWFNFLAGFACVASGMAIWMGRRAALSLSLAIVLATAIVGAGFGVWVIQGGAFEMRTVGALALRFAIWLPISLVVHRAGRP